MTLKPPFSQMLRNQSTGSTTHRPNRRAVLQGSAALAATFAAGGVAAQGARMGPARMVTFEDVIAHAKDVAEQPFVRPANPAPELIEKVDYNAHWKIQFRPEASLYPGTQESAVQLFHPGRYFPEPVRIYLRNEDGTSQEVMFNEDVFSMPEDSPAHALPEGYGFAGFRVMRPDMKPDWVSFLGASYFRTDGPEHQYGLSARGIAVDVGLDRPEEFPRFTTFWLGAGDSDAEDISVWALLDGPSIAGAYRFGLKRDLEGEDGHLTRITAHLFARKDIERLGVAPLTSMYWYSERDRTIGKDWRPEIHDSDGLAMHAGSGEHIWRPLSNPAAVSTASFFDENPMGFGLIQRDRNFDHYQDDGVFYNRRPSAWIKPMGDWGRGMVQLVEIPTEDETFDNIVAYWVPEQPVKRGDSLTFDYDIEWRTRDPETKAVASVVATRQGQGGIPGNPIPQGVAKMVIDFEGPALNDLDKDSGVVPMVEATNGRVIEPIGAYKVVGTNQWRLAFDFEQDENGPVSLRAYLRQGDRALTETWLADAWVDVRG